MGKIYLTNYSHSRSDDYVTAANELRDVIDSFANQKELSWFYNYFNKRYKLPRKITKQKLKQHLSKQYRYRPAMFSNNLNATHIPFSILAYGMLIYALFFVRRRVKRERYKLIIDDICSPHELLRFSKIINLLGSENILCIGRGNDVFENFSQYNFHTKLLFRSFFIRDLSKAIFNELFHGIWIILKTSLATRVNLFPIGLQIVHSYLSSKSLFESYEADFLLQERHYGTNSVKNFIFKKYGGKATASLQKNILQLDSNIYYMDIDVLFSLGTKGFERACEYGGRIGNVIPVGSMFMESGWFSEKIMIEKQYDVVMLGINTSNAYDRMDSYDGFIDDYYSSYHWLVRFKEENPAIKIAIIHHSSAGKDLIEDEILKDVDIEIIDKRKNSYAAAFSSHCAVTYGSTMGFELNAHGQPTLFIDPNFRSSILSTSADDFPLETRVGDYSEFSYFLLKNISNSKEGYEWPAVFDGMCLESSTVSNKIVSYFGLE